jgi:hypothetical protein
MSSIVLTEKQRFERAQALLAMWNADMTNVINCANCEVVVGTDGDFKCEICDDCADMICYKCAVRSEKTPLENNFNRDCDWFCPTCFEKREAKMSSPLFDHFLESKLIFHGFINKRNIQKLLKLKQEDEEEYRFQVALLGAFMTARNNDHIARRLTIAEQVLALPSE